MKEAAITEKEIDEQRANYKPLADHATTLFTLTKMASIDPMYQYSLQWFTNLFIRTTQEADQADDQPGRLENLKIILHIYCMIKFVVLYSRSKMLFSYLIQLD